MKWLRSFLCLLPLLALNAGQIADLKMIPVIERDGQVYVSAQALNKEADVAIKELPGQNFVVACHRDRCSPLKDARREGSDWLLPVASLAQALGATAEFDAPRRNVGLHFTSPETPAVESVTRVGQLAPNFRLARLDGTPVSLADFRGRRLVINSWASW